MIERECICCGAELDARDPFHGTTVPLAYAMCPACSQEVHELSIVATTEGTLPGVIQATPRSIQ